MPLNRLAPEVPPLPRQFGQDVMPLMKLLKFEPRFETAMQQVRGVGVGEAWSATLCAATIFPW